MLANGVGRTFNRQASVAIRGHGFESNLNELAIELVIRSIVAPVVLIK